MKSLVSTVKSWFAPGQNPLPATLLTDSIPQPPALSEDAGILHRKVQALIESDQPVQAMHLAQNARTAAPHLAGYAFVHGLSLEAVGRHEEALEAYQAELAINPADSTARARRDALSAALAPLPAQQPALRSWHTSLPNPCLLTLQRSLHQYQYRGIPLLKNPFDFALYPLLIWRLQPRTIFEIGSKSGGSALWLAGLLENFQIDGHVFSLDIVRVQNVAHSRVTFLEGDGRALNETLKPLFLENLPRPWLVIEDADHAYPTSKAVLNFFHPWLRPLEYIIVEDGIISDLTQDPECNSGPHQAIKEFVALHPDEYEIDSSYCDFFGYNVTWCTNGFLKKVGPRSATAVSQSSDLAAATQLLQKGEPAGALEALGNIKARRMPWRGLDYLRAECLLQLKRAGEAIQALREELRYFPDHTEAVELLAKLAAEQGPPALPPDPEFRELFGSVKAYTMLGVERLFSLYRLAKEICDADLPGNFVECGVAAGGSCALLAAVAARHSRRPRRVFACDTFQGLPDPGPYDLHQGRSAGSLGWGGGTCAAPVASLQQLARGLGADGLLEPVAGFFNKSLPTAKARIGDIALLHVDGDWYDSTRQVLDNLYPQVIEGGRIQIDDYGFWEGCRRAVEDFQRVNHLGFKLNPIDETGVWLEKNSPAAPKLTSPPARPTPPPQLLNLGCGTRFHPNWTNLDLAPSATGVKQFDVRRPLPFPDATFDAVYHSHLLEHLPHAQALPFLRECFRVLKPGATLRVVVPDLEAIARLYLLNLERALDGDAAAAQRYHWIVLELIDQMVRDESGGEMRAWWRQNPMPAAEFVAERMGEEVQSVVAQLRCEKPALPNAPNPLDAKSLGRFRSSGEVHKWMYDRFSLAALLQKAGFIQPRLCSASQSAIAGFELYRLDITEQGAVRKPDSLFMEALKPAAS